MAMSGHLERLARRAYAALMILSVAAIAPGCATSQWVPVTQAPPNGDGVRPRVERPSDSASASKSEAEWLPAGLNIRPFTANLLEARAGSSYLLGTRNLELDIGASWDIYRKNWENKELSVGVDLFTFSRLRSENDLAFPVETIDYFFGANAGYKITKGNAQYGFRFRVSHVSAHIVDGMRTFPDWRNRGVSAAYSREFVELFPFYRIDKLRLYAGLTYIFHVRPTDVGKGIYQAGFDYYAAPIFGETVIPFIAYDFKITQIGSYFENNILAAGLKFGKWNGPGFGVRISYYSGKSIHGELYDISESYASIGFDIDL